jgi:hypothetical protein
MRQLLSDLYMYMSFFKGDYSRTLSFLQSQTKCDQIDLMTLKSVLGDPSTSSEQAKSQF